MRIPFGLSAPDADTLKLLRKLDFYGADYSACHVTQETGGLYFVEISSPGRTVSLVPTTEDGRPVHNIYFDTRLGVRELAVTSKQNSATPNDGYTFTTHPTALYHCCLYNRICTLHNIVLGDGAQRGYGKLIGCNLELLRAIRAENPTEHDVFINADEDYKKLWKLFPNWTDAYELQKDFVAEDIGLAACMDGDARAALPDRARRILAGETLARLGDERRARESLAEYNRIRLERNALVIRPQLIAALKKYSNPYALSLFGHHHEDRVQAVMNALNKAPTIAIAVKILKRQLNLMTDPIALIYVSESQIDPTLLDYRWQNEFPKRRALTIYGAEYGPESESGYVRALQKTLALLRTYEVAAIPPAEEVPSSPPAP